jgi:hypothetical protein
LIWRQVGSVMDAIRELHKRGILWAEPTVVSQQAVSERLRTFPPGLFWRVLMDVLPQMQMRWQGRKRPIAKIFEHGLAHFSTILILDGSKLDVLLKKVDLLRENEGKVLAGRLGALLDAVTLCRKNYGMKKIAILMIRPFGHVLPKNCPKMACFCSIWALSTMIGLMN